MIFYLRSSVVSEDIRLKKYVDACKKENIEYCVIGWDREGKSILSENEIHFKMLAPYGRLWKNAFAKLVWQFFLFFKLFYHRRKISTIHACDFDTMLPALLLCFFSNKKVIYDVYDAFSVKNPSTFFQRFIRYIDVFFIKKCDVLILADAKRSEQMGIDIKEQEKLFVVENVPNEEITQNSYNHSETIDYSEKIRLSYVGVLELNRGIENLLQFVLENELVSLDIAGVGSLNLAVSAAAEKTNRIRYHGFIPYKEGLKIMKDSHFIIGMYHPVTENQKYAAPNKFYESLFLGRPLVTSYNTLVGEKVEKFDTGFLVHDDYVTFKVELSNIIKSSNIEVKCLNAIKLWQNTYKTYFDKRLCGDYIELIKNN
ncbi:MAG: hypothetical protein LBI73_13765 [Myroides sp.]|jgi:glycosyltransferase involved in cell wall biosynthesis|nr:hypothetical protein [Myroides sp.]